MTQRGLIALVLSVVSGCGGGVGPMPNPIWRSLDGGWFRSRIWVQAQEAPVDTTQISLWTWPELSPVPARVAAELDPSISDGSEPNTMYIEPDSPLSDRWYAIRRQGPLVVPNLTLAGAIPLADGSHVWRLHGTPLPPEVTRLTEIDHDADGTMELLIEMRSRDCIEPIADLTPDDVVRVTQPGRTCAVIPQDGDPMCPRPARRKS